MKHFQRLISGQPVIHEEDLADADLLCLLIEKGADATMSDDGGWTLLHSAAQLEETPQSAKILLDNGALINAPLKKTIERKEGWGEEGDTPFHIAAKYNKTTVIIEILLAYQADVNLPNIWGWVPLHYAGEFNTNPEVIKILIKNGAFVDMWDNWQGTPFYYAAGMNPNLEVIKVFLDNDADINSSRINGYVPFHHAAWKNPNLEIIKHLVENGAYVHERGAYGVAPVHLAIKYNPNPLVVEYIKGLADNETD
ncbi:MAG: ankyrin repeat domain-containing protein [Halobacteriovoraceae bacterium]|nr:ankyrin repeat domain-containing protein [Halobacteriovoraceae bacterium]